MTERQSTRSGFTIVELLVVLAVIAILAGLIMAGLRSAVGTSRKTVENNNIRQIYLAWVSYANNSNEWLLPGFLDQATQTAWNVTYKNKDDDALNSGLTQTYPWRLLPWMDHDYSTFLGYRDATTEDVDQDVSEDWVPHPTSLPGWMSSVFGTPGSGVALQPAFGYNAYYIGGWYTNVGGVSVPEFLDASWTNAAGNANTGRVVATSLAQIDRPSETVIFASSTYRPPGSYKAAAATEDRAPGCAWIVPSFLGPTEIWSIGMGTPKGVVAADVSPAAEMSLSSRMASMLAPSPAPMQADAGTLVVYQDQGVPLRRFNRQASTVRADGSVENAGAGNLLNMQYWMRPAWKPDFRHGP